MDKIEELLTRGVDKVYPTKEDLEKVLRSGKKLTLYQGFDPTGTQLHLGHIVGLRKLKQWQNLGHHVIFLIGDGTGQAGDPSGKLKSRERFFTTDELRKNALDYVKQASKIVNFEGDNPIEIKYNGDWLNKLNLTKLLDLAGHFTVQQMIERDMFQKRIKENASINLREFLYPLLQGYDSVAMNVDLELGGTDQTFNMLAGRQLVKDYLQKEKFVMTTPLLTDSKGTKIGKSEGNVIALIDKPGDLFGKVMTLPDDVIAKAFEYLTDIPMEDIKKISEDMSKGINPVNHKKELAFEIVKQLNDDLSANKAQEEFEKVIQNKEQPSELKISVFDESFASEASIAAAMTATGTASSISDAKRTAEQGGVSINGELIKDVNVPFNQYLNEDEIIIKRGKHNIVKVKIDKKK